MGFTITVNDQLAVLIGGAAIGAAVATLISYRMAANPGPKQTVPGPFPVSGDPGEELVNATKERRKRLLNQEVMENIPTQVPNTVPSMEDCLRLQETAKAELQTMTPGMVLKNLQQGNARFWMGVAQRPEMNAMDRRAMIMQQFPKAAILGCSDSRVPIEIVFDQSLGDIFAIRVAGNAHGTGVAASIAYAVNHLKVKLVVVLGHEGCGAVRAAMLPAEDIGAEPVHLRR